VLSPLAARFGTLVDEFCGVLDAGFGSKILNMANSESYLKLDLAWVRFIKLAEDPKHFATK
jgi:hypothetical protein